MTPTALACFGGDEPAVPDQNLERAGCDLPIAEGAWAVDADVAGADDGFVPSLQPRQKQLFWFRLGLRLPRFLGRRWSP